MTARGARGDDAGGSSIPAGARAAASLDLEWRRTWIDDRLCCYGVAGEGPTVVFLHGWLVGYRTYRDGLRKLLAAGCRVLAPGLPGFGGTADLPRDRFSMAGYAEWVRSFLETVRFDGPALVVGHSFGGGVAIKTAQRHGELVSSLLLVNAVGGGAWSDGGEPIAERPLWHWGINVPNDLLDPTESPRMLKALATEAVPNLVRNPMGIVRVAWMIRRTDLTRELVQLRERGLPITSVWSEGDSLVTKASHDALCRAAGVEPTVIGGSHSWLVTNADRFAALVLDALDVPASSIA